MAVADGTVDGRMLQWMTMAPWRDAGWHHGRRWLTVTVADGTVDGRIVPWTAMLDGTMDDDGEWYRQ